MKLATTAAFAAWTWIASASLAARCPGTTPDAADVLPAAQAHVPPAAQADVPLVAQADREPSAEARERRLARWREALDLDLPAEVLSEAQPWIAPGGAAERDGETLALVARALAATGSAAEAETLCARPTSDDRGAHALLVERARLALAKDEMQVVLNLLAVTREGELVMVAPERPEAEFLCGQALVRLGRGPAARALLERFVAAEPHANETPAALHMLAQIAIGERALERAAELRKRARASAEWVAFYRTRRLQVREHPDDPLPRLGLAELWLAADERGRARTVLGELVARAPEFARGWSLFGDLERAEGRRTEARTDYERALKLQPNLLEARVGRARLARDEGRLGEARAELEEVVRSPGAEEARFLAAHLDLARVLRALGEPERAAERFARYRELGGREELGETARK